MIDRLRRRQCVAPRSSMAVPPWSLSLVRALLLLTIALLPVQMRAGSSEAHPHSILQLVLDAGDGTIDHHRAPDASDQAENHEAHELVEDECLANPDLPSVEETGRLGGISLLSLPLVLIFLPTFGVEKAWPTLRLWHGWQPRLDPPPPRARRV